MSIIKGDSLLSSISNISVLIKHGEGSEVFNFSMLHNNNEHEQGQRLYEVKIDDIFPRDEEEMMGNGSIMDNIIKKQERQNSIIHYAPAPILPQVTYNHAFNEKSWTITQQKGVSEDQNSKQLEDIQEKKTKNETKNIPKNYGKAIISFIEKYKSKVSQICQYTDVPFDAFFQDILQIKKTINTIADLRRLWLQYKYARCMRIISNLFLRKYSFSYIFNSRICNFKSHVKYRHRMCQGIRSPHTFRHIKDY